MVNSESLSFSAHCSPQPARIVRGKISAIKLIRGMSNTGRLGTITQLAENTQLEVCGEGFNERTVKVRCRDCFYFVFREDLEF